MLRKFRWMAASMAVLACAAVSVSPAAAQSAKGGQASCVIKSVAQAGTAAAFAIDAKACRATPISAADLDSSVGAASSRNAGVQQTAVSGGIGAAASGCRNISSESAFYPPSGFGNARQFGVADYIHVCGNGRFLTVGQCFDGAAEFHQTWGFVGFNGPTRCFANHGGVNVTKFWGQTKATFQSNFYCSSGTERVTVTHQTISNGKLRAADAFKIVIRGAQCGFRFQHLFGSF